MEIAFLGVRAGNMKQVIAETNGLQKAVDLLEQAFRARGKEFTGMESQTELLHSSGQPYFDVFGPRLQFLNTPEQTGNRFCFMKAILPPGVAIPLHRHPDPETLYVEDGSLEFLQFKDDSHRWLTAIAGDPNFYNFFRELDKPVDQDQPHALPTADDMQKLLVLSCKYNYWVASPEESSAIGLLNPAALRG